MLVRALGHAGLEVKTAGATVLVDPWFDPAGAYQASWFPFPANDHLIREGGPIAARCDAVIVSHEHLDHLDTWTLRRLSADVPILVPHYPSTVLRAKLEAAGRRTIIEVDDWEWVDMGDDLRVLFVREESPMNHDAAIVLASPSGVLVDLNDARLSPAQLRAVRRTVGGHVDLLTLQGSGASWHPMCYELALERKRELSRQKRASKLAYAVRAAKAVGADAVAPFAGPPCFLDPALAHHNDEMEGGIFPHQQDVAQHLLARRAATVAPVLLPGDTWEVSAGTAHRDPRWDGFSLASADDRSSHLAAYASQRRTAIEQELARWPTPAASLWQSFEEYFAWLLGLSPYFNDRIGMRVGFDVVGSGGGHWAVDFRTGEIGDDEGDCGYRYRIDSRWLAPLLSREVHWEDFLLSLRFTAWRDPDLHNEHLLGLLKFASSSALDAVQRYETATERADRVVVRWDSGATTIGRYCPHAGADLLDTSEVAPDGILRCLNHYYEFDLATGSCTNGVCAPLDVRPVAQGDAGLPVVNSSGTTITVER